MKTRKNIRLKGFDYSSDGYVYSLTICTHEKEECLIDLSIIEAVKQTLLHRNEVKEIALYCFCIMSNHVHLLLSLGDNYKHSLQEWVRSFKRYTSRIAKKNMKIEQLWQRNFYDHIIRKEESLQTIGEYILNNPVRKGLVDIWNDYPHSWVNERL